MRPIALLPAFLCTTLLPAVAQQREPGKAAPEPTIRTTAEEVLLDMVVRDRKGRLIRDLRPADLEVYEEGARQAIKSFRFVESASAGEASAEAMPAAGASAQPQSAAPKTFASPAEVRLVSLVFDRLSSPDARRLARDAAAAFVNTELGTDTLAGLFVLDARLSVLQPYTHDRELLLRKIDLVSQGGQALFRSQPDPLQKQIDSTLSKGGAAGSLAGGGIDNSGPPQGLAAMTAATQHSGLRQPPVPGAFETVAAPAEVSGTRPFLDMLARVIELESRVLQRNFDRTNLYSLANLIREQRALPGRKTMLFFSEGLRVPLETSCELRAAISEANRANVTIYSFDARGLSPYLNFEGRNELAAATATSAALVFNVYENDFRIFERSEAALSAGSQAGMRDLAESTGGFLVANTNNLAVPIHRIMEEARIHYELSYVPKSRVYDGRFRKIEVKPLRAGISVHTRDGYYAVPLLPRQTVFPYELPLLEAINSDPQPRTFGFHVEALEFRQGPGLAQAVAVFEVPRGSFTLAKRPDEKAYRTRMSFVALVRDSSGQIVQKITRDIALMVPVDRRDAFERGNLIFTAPFLAAPGTYTMDAGVWDGEGMRVSVARKQVRLRSSPGLALSDIVLARQVQGLEEKPDPTDPLQFEDKVVTPAISGVFRKRIHTELSLFCAVYPEPAAKENPELKIEFIKDGQPAMSTSATLSLPADGSAVPYLARFKTADFAPGDYEAAVTVRHGGATAAGRAHFSVEP